MTLAVEATISPRLRRTNIVLDEDLLDEARELGGIATKRGVVEEALRVYVRVRRQDALRQLRGTVTWDGDLAEMRRESFRYGDC